MFKENTIYVVTVSVDLDTNDTYYAYCPGIKGIHVSGKTRQEAIEEALKSVVGMIQIYSKKGEVCQKMSIFIS